ncbi:hypothetical protein ACOSQ2_004000 [Xanthoceras sorbifolium]
MREVSYPNWLANVVVVKKKNEKWQVCIDFTYLKKACPNDSFPLPHIDMLVDATAGHKLLSFIDTFSGSNQILMHPDNQENTSFITKRRIFFYKVNAICPQERWSNLPEVGQQNVRKHARPNHKGLYRRHAGQVLDS